MKLTANIMALIAVAMLALIGWQSWQEGSAARVVEAQASLERAETEKQSAINELVEDAVFFPGLICFGLMLILGGIIWMVFISFSANSDRMERMLTLIINEHKTEKLDDTTAREVLEYEKIVNIPHKTEVAR